MLVGYLASAESNLLCCHMSTLGNFSCFIWDAEKTWPMGSGQRSLKQVIKRAMEDEKVKKVTRKKFMRKKKPNSVVPSELLLFLSPWYLLLLSFSLWASQKLFQFDQLNDAEYGLSVFVFVIKSHWILSYTYSLFCWLVGFLKFICVHKYR